MGTKKPNDIAVNAIEPDQPFASGADGAQEGIKQEAKNLLKKAGLERPEKLAKAALNPDGSGDDDSDSRPSVDELRSTAAPVLGSPDPLSYISDVIKKDGYGGDTTPAVLTYIAITSRVLRYKPGQAPAHLMLKGEASSGKSHALNAVLRHMPKEAIYKMDAGSARALIYDDEPISHRAIVFSERDSLPKGDGDGDNPAASAIRSLLQDGRMDYRVTVKAPNGKLKTQHIVREGPSVLVTTGITYIRGQLGTRIFTYNMTEGREQIKSALMAAAENEEGDRFESTPDEALVSLQLYLQRRAQ